MADSFYSVVGLAGALATATGRAFVILNAKNSGGSQNLALALPSLDETQLDMLDMLGEEPLILGFPNDAAAQNAFNAFTAEARQGYRTTGSLVETTVTYVGRIGDSPVMTVANGSGFNSERSNTHSFFGGKMVNTQSGGFGG